jgi:hypothetical protein
MALDGLLQQMSFGEIFQTISLCKQSGVLTLTNEQERGQLIFSEGHLLHASVDSLQRFGGTLMQSGLITAEDLEAAVVAQRNGDAHVPFGEVLQSNGIISKEVLQAELKKYLTDVVRTLLHWETGAFHFEFGSGMKEDMLLGEGLNLPALLMEATRPSDPWHMGLPTDRIESPDRRREWTFFLSILSELSGPVGAPEILLLVLRYASALLNRSVVFMIKKKYLIGVGQSGLQFSDEEADARIKKMRIPLSEPSIFSEAIRSQASYKGPLAQLDWHQYFIDQVGGDWPSSVFLSPLMDGRNPVALLYGDHVSHAQPLPDTRGLEAFIRVAGMAYTKIMLERKLVENKQEAP